MFTLTGHGAQDHRGRQMRENTGFQRGDDGVWPAPIGAEKTRCTTCTTSIGWTESPGRACRRARRQRGLPPPKVTRGLSSRPRCTRAPVAPPRPRAFHAPPSARGPRPDSDSGCGTKTNDCSPARNIRTSARTVSCGTRRSRLAPARARRVPSGSTYSKRRSCARAIPAIGIGAPCLGRQARYHRGRASVFATSVRSSKERFTDMRCPERVKVRHDRQVGLHTRRTRPG